ncbi:recombinase RecB [Corynebacterium yudongzhengii]|uniref:TM0106 family RecB-like putative nuclease n=1 Tax=Corynebacterium yudongzhengii TaxID=2080740 RepID=A0A2U1T7Z4_9CORY|nr:TM0106 family RecB-like putative nuclease [Corynebacterium yudongzhengii]AWB82810.1 recombinase RecB [Corynebacterium yudongzhengii]PWC02130.1 TM0106 family RecB-like putative nuclease [Corynebacterium yudongzhengii]
MAADRTSAVTPSDLVGCRFRYPQRRAHPEIEPLDSDKARRARLHLARAEVLALLPVRPALGDGRRRAFSRIDLDADAEDADLATLEALAAEPTILTGAVLTGRDNGTDWRVRMDALIRTGEGTYRPVLVSNHRVARPHETRTTPMIPTHRLGLGKPVEAGYRLRHHVSDSHRLAMAARALVRMELADAKGALIGQDRRRAFVVDTRALQPALDDTLAAGWSTRPRRLKECAGCRFWDLCRPLLEEADDISLVLPGDRARTFRERGIETVGALIDARLGEPSALAAAWRAGVPVLRRTEHVMGPRADVEIDVDMEAYLDQGAYLWGAFDGEDYHGFVTWSEVGGAAEAENFAKFWDWLMQRRAQAHRAHQSFAAYCYSAHGENHWLRASARRFAGRYKGVPSLAEVEEFIASDEWVDVFSWVRRQLVGTAGIGLKVVAPQAGYHWSDDDVDGEESVNARRIAVAGGAEGERARAELLRYNADDTRATARVRHWLREGAQNVPVLSVPGSAGPAGR